jgi:predicted RNA-binding protein with PUA-like domain
LGSGVIEQKLRRIRLHWTGVKNYSVASFMNNFNHYDT